jgi:hypothetical protein
MKTSHVFWAALTVVSSQTGYAQVFNSVTVGQDAFSISYPYSYESVAAAPNANLRLQSKNSLFIHTGTGLVENFQFTSNGYLNFQASGVAGISKNTDARFDIGPVGGIISDNPFWRGLHISGPMINQNGNNEFPRLSVFQESTSLTNPNDLNYVLHPGNSSATVGIHLRTSNAGNIILSPGAGKIGIGTANPTAKLDVKNGSAYSASGTWLAAIQQNENSPNKNGLTVMNAWASTDSKIFEAAMGWNGASSGYYPVFTIDGIGRVIISPQQSEAMRINEVGNVGIGTTNPTHKLAVNGTIKAKEVIVETGWSDYVFADDYALAPLAEVEAHIKEHKHLPGIPSAAQVAVNGVSLGEVQSALLAKVEELTLHLIAQEKSMKTLQSQNVALQARVQQLEAR